MSKPRKTGVSQGGQVTISFFDSIRLIRDQVDWTPKGVRLLSKWHFAEGAEIEFAFDHKGTRHCCSGIVVGCHPLAEPPGYYQMILFFIEVPCSQLQKAASACRLARENHAQDETHFTSSHQPLKGMVIPGNARSAGRNQPRDMSREEFKKSSSRPRSRASDE